MCTECGCVLDDVTALLAHWKLQYELADQDVRGKRLQIHSLKAELDGQRKVSKHHDAAQRVLYYWKEQCMPRAREPLSKERLKVVIDRLKAGWTEQELMAVVDGFACYPYTSIKGRQKEGTVKDRRLDAELLFRDEKHVLEGLTLAQRALYEEKCEVSLYGIGVDMPGELNEKKMSLFRAYEDYKQSIDNQLEFLETAGTHRETKEKSNGEGVSQ